MSSTFKFLVGSLALEDRPFHHQVARLLMERLADSNGYLAYKLTTLGRASDDDVPSFIIITRQHGIVLLDVVEERIEDAIEEEGAEYWVTEGKLIKARNFVLDIYEEEVRSRLKNDVTLYDRKTRQVKVPVSRAVVFCSNAPDEVNQWFHKFVEYNAEPLDISSVSDWIDTLQPEFNASEELFAKVCSLIEGTFIFQKAVERKVDEPLVTVNDYIQRSLRTTFRQDEAQRIASLQLPPGPQRIRGLAGTGKTIVLSIKAAVTHKRFPEFKILYLFNTQSLYSHVQSLISKYYALEAKKAPDFDSNVHVLHAWGGKQKLGLYSMLCMRYGLVPLTLTDVRGRGDGLQVIYQDFLSRAGAVLEPMYDLILIDEAQDFPPQVFEVIFRLAKGEPEKKRIIWAYDEFQSLREADMKGPAELFGKNDHGEPNIPDSWLTGDYDGGIQKDFVLPNCYRTPRPVLMTAHGMALGLYADKPNEMFYHREDWSAIGYRVTSPDTLLIEAGDNVEILRPDENSKNILENLLLSNQKSPTELVQVESFGTMADQLEYVSSKIADLVQQQNVAPEEIIIVNLRGGNNKEEMLTVQRELTKKGISSVLPGYVESADVFKPHGFVTITTPFRAKGNEANIVFVLNSQKVGDDFTLRARNAFFVAVTRSRGWCYITGFGPQMEKIQREIGAIKAQLPYFRFVCPERDQVQRRKSFLMKSDKELDQIQAFFELMEKSPELRQEFSERFNDRAE